MVSGVEAGGINLYSTEVHAMGNIIGAIILGVIAIACFVLSYLQFKEIGLIFLSNAIDMIIQTGWLFYLVIGIAIVAIVYAIVSSFVIEKRKSEI